MYERSEDLPASLPLSALWEIDWAALRDAYGPASAVPQLITDLTLGPERRKRAEWELYGNVFHQGTVYEASPFTIPFLVGLLAFADLRLGLLQRLLSMAIGYEESVFPNGVDLAARQDEQRRLDASNQRFGVDAVRTHEAVTRAWEQIIRLLDDSDPEVRAETAHLVAYLPGEAERSITEIQKRLRTEDAASSSFLLALAVLGRTSHRAIDVTLPDIIGRALDVRIAQSCARSLLGYDQAIDELVGLMGEDLPPIGTWLDGSTITIVTASMAAHEGWPTMERIESIGRHLCAAPWTQAPWLAGIMLEGTMNGVPLPHSVDDLSAEQTACLKALLSATAWTVNGAVNVNWADQLDAFLVPSRREDLESYLGGATLRSCLSPHQAKQLAT